MILPLWPMAGSQFFPGHFMSGRSGLVLLLMLTVAAITDIRGKKIFNWTTYPGFIFALILNASSIWIGDSQALSEGNQLAPGEIGLWASALGALACFFPMIMIRNFTGGGAGDVKLATAIGALVGAQFGLKIVVFCYLIGGVSALILLTWTNGPWQVFITLIRRIGSRLLPMYVLPPTNEQALLFQGRMALGPYFALSALYVLSGVDNSWLFAF